ncbi:hypothetical protein HK098_001637 [Nowakowskiella sp. JEL0407]|nr:hypothetical protein HK098_001637 [Nowakowskiella sp. JEL0407]
MFRFDAKFVYAEPRSPQDGENYQDPVQPSLPNESNSGTANPSPEPKYPDQQQNQDPLSPSPQYEYEPLPLVSPTADKSPIFVQQAVESPSPQIEISPWLPSPDFVLISPSPSLTHKLPQFTSPSIDMIITSPSQNNFQPEQSLTPTLDTTNTSTRPKTGVPENVGLISTDPSISTVTTSLQETSNELEATGSTGGDYPWTPNPTPETLDTTSESEANNPPTATTDSTWDTILSTPTSEWSTETTTTEPQINYSRSAITDSTGDANPSTETSEWTISTESTETDSWTTDFTTESWNPSTTTEQLTTTAITLSTTWTNWDRRTTSIPTRIWTTTKQQIISTVTLSTATPYKWWTTTTKTRKGRRTTNNYYETSSPPYTWPVQPTTAEFVESKRTTESTYSSVHTSYTTFFTSETTNSVTTANIDFQTTLTNNTVFTSSVTGETQSATIFTTSTLGSDTAVSSETADYSATSEAGQEYTFTPSKDSLILSGTNLKPTPTLHPQSPNSNYIFGECNNPQICIPAYKNQIDIQDLTTKWFYGSKCRDVKVSGITESFTCAANYLSTFDFINKPKNQSGVDVDPFNIQGQGKVPFNGCFYVEGTNILKEGWYFIDINAHNGLKGVVSCDDCGFTPPANFQNCTETNQFLPSSTRDAISTEAAVGIALGGAAVVGMAVAGIVFLILRKRPQRKADEKPLQSTASNINNSADTVANEPILNLQTIQQMQDQPSSLQKYSPGENDYIPLSSAMCSSSISQQYTAPEDVQFYNLPVSRNQTNNSAFVANISTAMPSVVSHNSHSSSYNSYQHLPRTSVGNIPSPIYSSPPIQSVQRSSPPAYIPIRNDSLPSAEQQRKIHFSTNVSNAVVAANYYPEASDEIELVLGDMVCITTRFADGWVFGKNMRTGLFGVFPVMNFVEQKIG